MQKKEDTAPSVKKRRTVDDLIGTNVLLSIAVIAAAVVEYGGFIGVVAFLSGVYRLIRHRQEISRNRRLSGIVLVIIYLVSASIPSIVAYIDATSQM